MNDLNFKWCLFNGFSMYYIIRVSKKPKGKLSLAGDDKNKLIGKQPKPLTIKMANSNW